MNNQSSDQLGTEINIDTKENHPQKPSSQTEPHNLFSTENFVELFEEYEKDSQPLIEGTVVKGVIVGITHRGVAIDIGAK